MNIFIENKEEIAKIGSENNVDIGVATDMFCNQNKISIDEHLEEYEEFVDILTTYQLSDDKTLADFFNGGD